jgi:histidinol-phosphate aminotransferase
MAGARLGMTFADPDLITFLNRIKAPYNLNSLTINAALQRLEEQELVKEQVAFMLKERLRLEAAFEEIEFIKTCFPSDANFVLIRLDDSSLRYQQLLDQGIVVRNPSKNTACENTLRISVGLTEENNALINALRKMDQ